MNKKNRKLKKREQEFIDKIDAIGKFEYIGGYKNIKSDVKVYHKKCGCKTTVKAYNIAYKKIDKCEECGRQVRSYDKCKTFFEELNPNIEVVGRQKDECGKNRYFVKCRDCGDIFYVSYDTLKEGKFTCCSDGVGGYERASKYKAKEIYNNLKKNALHLTGEVLEKHILEEIKDDVYLKSYKGLCDDEKLVQVIKEYIEARYIKDRIGTCSVCNEYKAGTKDWGRKRETFEQGVCVKCLKSNK